VSSASPNPTESARRWQSDAEPRILAAFHNAAGRVPAYRTLLSRAGVDPGTIRTFADFTARVPLTDKDSLFGAHEIPDLCLDGSIDGAVAAYTSSGYSGTFSFGLETAAQAGQIRQRIDQMLGLHFGAPDRRTLLINALPMGVHVPAGAAMVIDTGTRTDAALAAVRKLGRSFDQIVIIAEHPLLKKIIEDGVDAKINWPAHRVNLVTGAEVMPESFRTYAGRLLGHNDDETHGKIVVSLGISEVGLSIGQELPFCRRVRKIAANDPAVRCAIFGSAPFVPTFVQWSPEDYWLETIAGEDGKQRLVITTLATDRKISLIRYATGDWAAVIDPQQLALRAGEPEYPLPCVAVWGRGRSVRIGDHHVYPEQVKEVLYSHADVARATTANFRLMHDASGSAAAHVRLQLKPSYSLPSGTADAFAQELSSQFSIAIRVTATPFESFPDDAAVSYQRKFRYVD
jgi:phenylacetate-CoA ligase